jgi:hypothetical protein
MDQTDHTNKLLTEIRDAIKEGVSTRHRDSERLIEQLTKLREALSGSLERPKREPKPLIDRPKKPRKTRVRK